jgi:hypothetical protein
MKTIAVQYLEAGPHLAGISPAAARAKLRLALEELPISAVLLGWTLPPHLVDACREETLRAGARLYLWHPLLVDDGVLHPRPEWLTIGLSGEPVPGHQAMAEFTFVCPNRPAVREAMLARMSDLLATGRYDGFFLDKMRFPSPAPDPSRWLGCFCPDCERAATAQGVDLAEVRHALTLLLAQPDWRPFLTLLLGAPASDTTQRNVGPADDFMSMRAASITGIVHEVATLVHAAGLAIGLDCFSPALTRMVGQDLGALDRSADWTKVMSYCHTLGPAGLPFELLGLADWLVERRGLAEPVALAWLSETTGLPLPTTRKALRKQGLAPAALARELARGRSAGVETLLAGIELVDLPGLAQLSESQALANLQVVQQSQADGVVLSWDLWQIPPVRLAWVRRVWSERGS